MTTKGSAVVFMIGAVAGGVTALLLAPQSGAQIRGRLKNRAEEFRAKHKKGNRPESITGRGAVSEPRLAYRDELDRRRQPDAESIARKTGS